MTSKLLRTLTAMLGATLALALPAAAQSGPGPVTNLSATPGNGQVSLSWTAPADNGGSAITEYSILGMIESSRVLVRSIDTGTSVPDPGSSWTPTGTTATIGGLTNGTQYAFQVRALMRVAAAPGPRWRWRRRSRQSAPRRPRRRA